MIRKIMAILAALLMLCLAAGAAQAETVMLAFGCEYELPEGVTIAHEEWTPEKKDVVYYMDGAYEDGAKEFACAIYHADGFGKNMSAAISAVQKKTGSTAMPLNTEIAGKWGICVDISGGVPNEKLVEWMDGPAGFAIDFMFCAEAFGLFEAGAAPVQSGMTPAAQSAEEAAEKENAEESVQQALRTAVVNTKSSPLSMRETPDQSGKTILEICKGETVSVLEEGEWPLIEYGGRKGYVNGKYLK